MKIEWKIKHLQTFGNLEILLEIKKGKKKIGTISKNKNENYYQVYTSSGTGSYQNSLESAKNWLKVLNQDIFGRNFEIEII